MRKVIPIRDEYDDDDMRQYLRLSDAIAEQVANPEKAIAECADIAMDAMKERDLWRDVASVLLGLLVLTYALLGIWWVSRA